MRQNTCRMNCANVLCKKLLKQCFILHSNMLKLAIYFLHFAVKALYIMNVILFCTVAEILRIPKLFFINNFPIISNWKLGNVLYESYILSSSQNLKIEYFFNAKLSYRFTLHLTICDSSLMDTIHVGGVHNDTAYYFYEPRACFWSQSPIRLLLM